jgi:hypothetical protein
MPHACRAPLVRQGRRRPNVETSMNFSFSKEILPSTHNSSKLVLSMIRQPPESTRLFLLSLVLLSAIAVSGHAQGWSGILAPNRAIDWSGAGVTGGIPSNRTQCGSTIAPYTGAPTTINNALAACGGNRYVQLGAGTFNLSSGIKIQRSNVTLRGAGADQTSLVFSSTDPCQGLYADICVESYDINWSGGPSNGPVNWTAGYSKGTTVITLASVPNLKVGNPIILDQLDDSSDTGSVYVCSVSGSNCSLQGGGGGQRSGRYQFQIAMVTGCNGSTTPGFSCSGKNVAVTIDRGLDMPNWRSSQSPQAWWATNPVSGIGIEDLSVDNTVSEVVAGEGISFFNATNSWVRGVRDIKSHRAHVGVEYSAHITVRDSYFFLTQNSIDQSYGIDCFASSDNLIENNIYQAVSGPLTMNGCTGTVFGYNYAINGYYTGSAGWIQAMTNPHTGGVAMILYEGNVGSRIDSDNFHGSHNFITAFRNYWSGYSPACWQSGGTYATSLFGTCTNPFMAANLLSYSRFYNFVGNVLGQSAVQSGSVYSIGGGNSANGVTVANDPNVGLTLMRWGNYDTVTATSRFVASEVPTSLAGAQAPFSNPVPANNALPSTFYLPAKPAWWPSTKAWPAIGPDVTGGNAPGVGGHVYTIPAQDCFLNTMGGASNGAGGPYTFNANTCYGKPPRPI